MRSFRRSAQALTAKSWFRLPRQPMLRHLSFAVVAVVGLYFLTQWLSAFNDYEVGEIAFYVIALAGLTVLTGINGQISLGHGGFMAVGAFTYALLVEHTTWNLVPELLVVVAITGHLQPGDRDSGHPPARPVPGRDDPHGGSWLALSDQPIQQRLRR